MLVTIVVAEGSLAGQPCNSRRRMEDWIDALSESNNENNERLWCGEGPWVSVWIKERLQLKFGSTGGWG